MPLLSGIDIAKEIRNIDKITNIIFLTSSPEFALASYSVRANNYLLKPFTATELFRILDDVAEIIKKYINTFYCQFLFIWYSRNCFFHF
ncbi:response regulator [Clostridium isatidis]|uniref:response regulator n=1 Tax=Clostridium isatidis TaxID=182773 RepID=UPI003AAE97C7